MIIHYIQIALRNLLKYKTQNFIGILGLSVGLFCFSVCLYCSRYVNSVDKDFKLHDRLVEATLYSDSDKNRPWSGTPAFLSENMQQIAFPEVEAITRLAYSHERSYNVKIKENTVLPYILRTIETDSVYRQLFTPRVIYGTWQTAAVHPNAIVLTASASKRIFGEEINPIGKNMYLNQRLRTSPETTPKEGGITYSIQAVIEDIPLNNSFSFMRPVDMLVLNDSEGLLQYSSRNSMTGCDTYVLLRKDKQADDLNKSIEKAAYKPSLYDERLTVVFSPMGNNYKSISLVKYLSIVTACIGFLVLFSGLLNFFHFLIGSFYTRTKEYSIRKLIGGDKLNLFGLLLTQSLLMLILSGLLMFGMIEVFAPHLNITLNKTLLSVDTRLLFSHAGQYLLILFFLCMLICFFTVIRIQHITIQEGVRGTSKRMNRNFFRNLMLGIQLFICWIFISCTMALYLQSDITTNALFGTLSVKEKMSVFSVPLNYSFMKNEQKHEFIDRLKKHSGVEDVLISDVNYIRGGVSGTGMLKEKGNEDSYFEVNIISADTNFFSFMHIPILSGNPVESSGQMLADQVLSERLENIMGNTYYNSQNGYTVCGITAPLVNDVYRKSMGFVFLPMDSDIRHCYVKSIPGREQDVQKWINNVQTELLPSSIQPPVVSMYDEICELQFIETKFKNIILFLSVVCLIITLLGVYSAITLDTSRRQKEVAVRKINGAGLKQIMLLFMRMYFRLLLATALFAFPVVWLVIRQWRQLYTLFFNCNGWFWGSIFLGVTSVIILTIISRTLRTAFINPAEIIKSE